MVDVNDINELKARLDEVNLSTEESGVKLKLLEEIYGRLTRSVNDVSISLKDLGSSAGVSAEELSNLNNAKRVLISLSNDAKGKIMELGGSIVGLSGVNELSSRFGGDLVDSIKKNIGLFGVWKANFVRNLVDPSKDYRGLSTGVFKGINEGLRNLLNVQNVARTGFMMLGHSISESREAAEKYPQSMRLTSSALGIAKDELLEFNRSVRTIPGMLGNASESTLKYVGVKDNLIQKTAVLMTTMRAFGLSTSEMSRMATDAFYKLGRSPEQTLEMLGEMHGAMRGVDIDSATASRQMLEASNVMGIFGNQASLATNIWSTFAHTLRSSGVAAGQVGEIVKQVTGSIANMSVQNRAFISMMSGMFRGATALGGTLRMELAMRTPGGLEKNLEALSTTLGRFGGGRIITLEQAAVNPQLEMQFALQRQMLGKLTNITNTEQQNRVLEVLQGVQRGGVSRIEGSRELNDLMKRGRNVQEQMLTVLERHEQILQANIFGVLTRISGDLDKGLTSLQRAFGVGTRKEDIGETAIGLAGAVPGLAEMGRPGAAHQALVRSQGAMARELRRFAFGTGRRPTGPQRLVPSEIAGQPVTTGLSIRSHMNAFRRFLAEFAGDPLIRARDVRPATLPTAPTGALVPSVAGVMPTTPTHQLNITREQANNIANSLTQLVSQIDKSTSQTDTVADNLAQSVNQIGRSTSQTGTIADDLNQLVNQINRSVPGAGVVTTAAEIEAARATMPPLPGAPTATAVPGVGTPTVTPTPIATRSESAITIKVDVGIDELHDKLMEALNSEVPNIINKIIRGENTAGGT
jgi:hypothetical protein